MTLGNIIENLPSLLPRDPASVLRRYVEAHEDEVKTFEQTIQEVEESHQIDNASGQQLDEIGALFGVLGKRRGRSDQEYRIYLKTIVEAFNGRGTVPGIISAVAAGLGTEESNVSVTEDFENLEYDIILEDWPSHRGSTIEELAALADASVSQLNRTVYKIGEQQSVADEASTAIGSIIGDDLSVDDFAAVTRGETFDDATADDANFVDQNKNTVADESSADDDNFVDQNKNTVADESSADDTALITRGETFDDATADDAIQDVTVEGVAWDNENWDSFNWATENN